MIAYIPVDQLYSFMVDVFKGLGTPEEDAKNSTDVLIESDLRGIPSHGVQRLYYYYKRIKGGQHLPETNFEVVKDKGATAVVDGHHGNGHVIATKSMKLAIEKAKKYGIGMVVVRNSTHYGIAGYYPLLAIKEGCIGITGTNARPAIAPTFSVEPMLGTNPLAFGMPTDEEFPFVLDAATSIIQRGKVELYARENKPLLEGWVIDDKGKPKSDAQQLLKDFIVGKGALVPLGGVGEEFSGYKGYGYATVVEILSSALQAGQFLKALSGIATDGSKTHFQIGHFFIAIDIDHFLGLDTFKEIAGEICRQLRNSRKAPGAERIYTAGEKEFEAEKIVRKQGVPLSESLQRDLILMRDELKLTQYRFPFE